MTKRLLVLLLTVVCATAVVAAKRKIVPVPAWDALDGARWGELALGETARAAFERDYSCRETNGPGVLEGNTSNRTQTQLFLVFDGPGPEARLQGIACFYDGSRGAPSPLELEGRFGSGAAGGYLPGRRADWRLRVAASRGVAAVLERGEQRERVAAMVFAPPELLAAFARRLSATETEIDSPLERRDREPLAAQIAYVDADVDVDRAVSVERRRLRREVERAAEDEVRQRSSLQMGGRGGRLTVTVEVEPHRKRDEEQIRITARATLNAEGPYGIVSARGGDSTRDLPAGSGDSRVQREARRLVEQVVDAVAGSAQSQLQERRSQALAAARREARLSLVASLARPDR